MTKEVKPTDGERLKGHRSDLKKALSGLGYAFVGVVCLLVVCVVVRNNFPPPEEHQMFEMIYSFVLRVFG